MTQMRIAQMVYVNLSVGTSAWIVFLTIHPFPADWALLSHTGVYL